MDYDSDSGTLDLDQDQLVIDANVQAVPPLPVPPPISDSPSKGRSFFSSLKRAFSSRKRGKSPKVNEVTANGVVEKADDTKKDELQDGSRLEIKRLDLVYDRTKSIWVKRESESQEATTAKDEFAEFAFTVIRKFKVTTDPTLHIITTTYEVKSSQLRKIGEEVIGRVLGLSWTSRTVSVDPQIFMAFLPNLEAHLKSLRAKQSQLTASDSELATEIEHLTFLVDFINKEHESTLKEIQSLLANGEISFDLGWALFVPRTIMYTPCPISKVPRAVRLVRATKVTGGMRPGWNMEVEYVEYHGHEPQFGVAPLANIDVPKFAGTMKITSMNTYPLKYHPKAEELTKTLIERGKKWCSLQGVYLKYYNTTGFHYRESASRYVKLNTQSRIVVDKETFKQIMPNYFFPTVTKTLSGENVSADTNTQSQQEDNNFNATAAITDDIDPENPPWKDLKDEDLLLASPLVYGFSLADKLWMEFSVDGVQSFTWNDEPFENLVLARDQKSIVLSLVEAHTQGISHGFDDFVRGKGQGLVINLFGNPGVGKSLTAEATSEHVRKPLYVVGAGDLGTDPQTLDLNLTRIFTISSRWGAVVLIDEADVFLEERSFHDLTRNAMVAVFLRQLEYFRGILFLTTNRVRTFDEAFQSRIHVSLRYHDLTSDAKRQIWNAFLKKAKTASPRNEASDGSTAPVVDPVFTRDELHELGEKSVNGRQIKNVVRTASALATARKQTIGFKHLIEVLDMMEQFEATNSMYQ